MGWLQDLWAKLKGERPAPVDVKPEARAVQQEMAGPILTPAPLPEIETETETETVNDAPVAEWSPVEPEEHPEGLSKSAQRRVRTLKQAEANSVKLTKSGKPRKERKDKGVKRGPRKVKGA